MLLKDMPRFERIDGVSYVWGSKEHSDAIDRAIARTFQQLTQSEGIGAKLRERCDANQVAFLARDLVYVSRDVQQVLYDKLRAVEFVAVRSEVPRGAETWVYRQQDIRGKARKSAHLEANDPPLADVSTEEFQNPLINITEGYAYTIDELEAAAFARTSLSRDKANASAEIIARGLDELLRIGDAATGITGFFNNPNVPVITLTNGEWLTATVAEIIADWAQVEQAVISNSRDNHSAKRCILPTAYEGHLSSTPRSDGSDMTLRKWLETNARDMKDIRRWIALDDATGDDVGVSDPPQGIAYDPDPTLVFAEIPVPYEELPPQARGYGWVVSARARAGGVIFKRPKSAAYMENLD